jgi:hypothetical protein
LAGRAPRNQVPQDRADQSAEDHGEGHDVEVDHSRTDGCRDGAEGEGGDEIEERAQTTALPGERTASTLRSQSNWPRRETR